MLRQMKETSFYGCATQRPQPQIVLYSIQLPSEFAYPMYLSSGMIERAGLTWISKVKKTVAQRPENIPQRLFYYTLSALKPEPLGIRSLDVCEIWTSVPGITLNLKP